ncbi:MAG: spore maturation protein [Bacilli bacterium]|nr:spore maturation protein [Bacilli bacterium]
MINKIWFFLIFIGLLYSFITGNNNMNSIVLNSADEAYKLLISMIPLIVLWSGIMNIANDSGLLHKFSKLLRPILKRLFPSVKSDKPLDYIASNVAANMIGLGSAATPYGLKAMEELQKENDDKSKASEAMITFLVLNTGGVTLIPMTVISMRMMYGSINPTSIIIPSIIATLISSISGLVIDYIIRRKNAK